MDSRLEALLAAVRAAPADDMPRLVLADELQRRGDSWGEIIVMSCRLAALDADSTEARKLRLWIRGLCRRRWPALDARSTVVRGFLQDLDASDVDLQVADGPESTFLRALRLSAVTQPGLSALSRSSIITRVDELALAGPAATTELIPALERAQCSRLTLGLHVGPPQLAAMLGTMFATPLGAYLRQLELSWLPTDPADGERRTLTAGELAWPALEALTCPHLTDDDVTALVQAPALLGLRALDLRHGWLGDRGVDALARASFRQLASLALHGYDTTQGAVARIGQAAPLQALHQLALDIPWTVVAEPLTELAALTRLTELRLTCATTPEALQAMYRAMTARLERLGVTALDVEGEAGLPPLDEAAFTGLRSLQLGHDIGDAGVLRIASAHLPQLIELDLATTHVGPEAAHALVRSTLSPTLRLAIHVGDRDAPYVRALEERFTDVMAL